MKKRTRLSLFLLLLVINGNSVQAQTLKPCVVVEQTDGTRTEFVLTSDPRITYNSREVTLKAIDAMLQLPVTEVKKVYLSVIENEKDGIGLQQAATLRVCFVTDGLRLNGLSAGAPVLVYSADGRMLLSQNAGADGTLTLSFSHLPLGLLIIMTNNQSFKVIRK